MPQQQAQQAQPSYSRFLGCLGMTADHSQLTQQIKAQAEEQLKAQVAQMKALLQAQTEAHQQVVAQAECRIAALIEHISPAVHVEATNVRLSDPEVKATSANQEQLS